MVGSGNVTLKVDDSSDWGSCSRSGGEFGYIEIAGWDWDWGRGIVGVEAVSGGQEVGRDW